MNKINNPILPGFNPDPSIIRVGEDYYIATSTFEWFPGVQIHHSRDLINWRLAARPLKHLSQLNMLGNPDSCGIWAPCLTYDQGIFYLVYTDVKSYGGGFLDTHNFLVTTKDILGDWSQPVYLNSIGFDPSLFHDDDGHKYFVGMTCDNGMDKNWFGGILLQEYDPVQQRLIGDLKKIFSGTELGCTEGPHLYKRNGYYYLMTAEGGTGVNHAVTMARSKNIEGPYEVDPANPIVSSRYNPELTLQKAGHADFVETPEGDVYLVHLCGRPTKEKKVCILGRETSIQKMNWTEDGWLRMAEGGREPKTQVSPPNLPPCPWPKEPDRDEFDSLQLSIHFQSLRIPLGEDMLSLKERGGFLRLKGRESLGSKHRQSLIARRQQAFSFSAQTCVEFSPINYKQMAGLICYYSTENFHYLYITKDAPVGKCLGIMTCDQGKASFPLSVPVSVDGWERIHMRVEVRGETLQFFFSEDELCWQPIGSALDASILSD